VVHDPIGARLVSLARRWPTRRGQRGRRDRRRGDRRGDHGHRGRFAASALASRRNASIAAAISEGRPTTAAP
jgi:hypothetical protein